MKLTNTLILSHQMRNKTIHRSCTQALRKKKKLLLWSILFWQHQQQERGYKESIENYSWTVFTLKALLVQTRPHTRVLLRGLSRNAWEYFMSLWRGAALNQGRDKHPRSALWGKTCSDGKFWSYVSNSDAVCPRAPIRNRGTEMTFTTQRLTFAQAIYSK